jgi:hypothetical protein
MGLMFNNNASSRLKVAIDAATLSFQVYDGEGAKFPQPSVSGDYFWVTIDDRRTGQVEICKCTSRTGDFLGVERGQDGTLAQSFLAGAVVSNRFTAETLQEILNASGYTKTEADAKFVDVTGDTMTGALTVVTPPVAATDAASKAYVDTKAPEAPAGPTVYGRNAGAWTAVVTDASYTAADVLAKLLTVDGSGSGLDADLLDGNDSAFFGTASALSALTTSVNNIDVRVTAVESGKAPLASPALTGNPTAPTAAPGDNDTSLATTAFVQAAVAPMAPLASPVFTGDPRAPTPATTDNDISIATTAFVKAQGYVAPDAPSDGSYYSRRNQAWAVNPAVFVDAPSDGSFYGRQNAAWAAVAPLASPVFTGNPTAPTPLAADNDTSIATTAFVQTALTAASNIVEVLVTTVGTTVWNKPAGLRYLEVEGVGPGGGGGAAVLTGASQGSAGSGAGAGGYGKRLFTAAELPASVTITIGSPGANSADGGTTSFGALASCAGGIKGNNTTAGPNVGTPGGIGGTATGWTINAAGAPGHPAYIITPGTVPVTISGTGGSSPYGGGGYGLCGAGVTAVGNGAVGYGSGGGGAANGASIGAAKGGGTGSGSFIRYREIY